MDLNLQSCWLLARAASPHLRAADGGKLINGASTLRFIGSRGESANAAAKHGLIGLTRALALEWGRHDIQVNALARGYVEAEMTRGMLEDDASARWVKQNTPMGAGPTRRDGRAHRLSCLAGVGVCHPPSARGRRRMDCTVGHLDQRSCDEHASLDGSR